MARPLSIRSSHLWTTLCSWMRISSLSGSGEKEPGGKNMVDRRKTMDVRWNRVQSSKGSAASVLGYCSGDRMLLRDLATPSWSQERNEAIST
ncbi:hypothetical protein ARMGADRAFT_609344 [Armillaria gallica]|uniref:Uncharacterized protein n=1 Tax=Armillaria gallica TaxID=47427 RepID=A0A2H3CRE8_ARMGA|nr:hypothetical protein ARMGADRAFT_609344 [Armillaria gallica]